MKSFPFSFCDLHRVTLLLVLLSSLAYSQAFAVELIGKPTTLSSSSTASAQVSSDEGEPEGVDNNEQDSDLAVSSSGLSPQSITPAQPFNADMHFSPFSENTLIPLVAISFGIGGPILLIIVLVGMHYRAKERRTQNINANIERLLAAGRDIPLELLRGDEPFVGDEASLARDDINLHKGIKNICLGIGLLIALTLMFGVGFGGIGFIVLSIGISQLWLWKLSGKKNSLNQQG